MVLVLFLVLVLGFLVLVSLTCHSCLKSDYVLRTRHHTPHVLCQRVFENWGLARPTCSRHIFSVINMIIIWEEKKRCGLRVPLVTITRARVHFLTLPKGPLLLERRMASGGWEATDSIYM
jgi:hypothetical protein